MLGNHTSLLKPALWSVLLAAIALSTPLTAAPPAPGVQVTVETPALTIDALSFEWNTTDSTFGLFSVTRIQDSDSIQLITAYYSNPLVGEVTINGGGLTVTLSEATLVSYKASGGLDPKGYNIETFTFEPGSSLQWGFTAQ